MRLTWIRAIAWHVQRQHLASRAPRPKLLEVVSDICGLHAQVMSSALLTAWSRVNGLSSDDLTRALWKDRLLVKTWAMRGTLHLLPASEYRSWMDELGMSDRYRTPSWLRYFGVERQELDRVISAIG